MSESTPSAPQPRPRDRLMRMVNGFWLSQMISVVSRLGVADALHEKPRTAAELAEVVGAHGESLYRVLRALACVDVLVEDEEGSFSLTELGQYLRKDHPDSVRALSMMEGEELYQAWGQLLHSVKTGESGFDKAHGKNLFEYLADVPESRELFDTWLSTVYSADSEQVATTYDFSAARKVVDIGGGNGHLLSVILDHHPETQGVIFDLPEAMDKARRSIEKAGLTSRCEAVSGSFFESVPSGADVYLLRYIIHDWQDDDSVKILKTCRDAMHDGSRLLIIECVIPPGNDWFPGKLLDVNMLVVTGGKERTSAQYEALFQRAGLRTRKIWSTAIPRLSIVEAEPVPAT